MSLCQMSKCQWLSRYNQCEWSDCRNRRFSLPRNQPNLFTLDCRQGHKNIPLTNGKLCRGYSSFFSSKFFDLIVMSGMQVCTKNLVNDDCNICREMLIPKTWMTVECILAMCAPFFGSEFKPQKCSFLNLSPCVGMMPIGSSFYSNLKFEKLI